MAEPIALMWRRQFAEAGALVDGTEEFYGGYYVTGTSGNVRWYEGSIGWKHTSPMLRGTRRFRWERMFLRELFTNITPEVYVYNAHDAVEIVTALFNKYGVPYDPKWVTNFAVNGNRLEYCIDVDFYNTLWTQRWAGDGWSNPLRVYVKQPSMNLAELFGDSTVSEPTMPYTVRAGYTNTEILTFSVDFTPTEDLSFTQLLEIKANADLNDMTADPTAYRAQNLVDLLSSRLGIPVTTEADIDGALSTANAKFIYNGPATGVSVANPAYDRVLIFDTDLDTNSTAARTYRGRVYMHYNNVI